MIDTILFDFIGVVIDSELIHAKTKASALEELTHAGADRVFTGYEEIKALL